MNTNENIRKIATELGRKADEEIKQKLKGISIDDLRQIDLGIEEYEPEIITEDNKFTFIHRYRYKIEPRKTPRSREEAEEIYKLVNS